MQESPETRKLTRRIVRLFFIVLAFVMLLTGYDHYAPLVFGNNKPVTDGGSAGILYWRDRRIARLQPSVQLNDNSAWTPDEVAAAVDWLKDFFTSQKIEYGLCAVHFDETASRRIVARLPQQERGERYLALLCDYNVYDDTESGDKQGYYPNAVFVLQQSADGKWSLPAGDPAIEAIVCPLEKHAF